MKVKVDLESFRSYGVLPEIFPEYEIDSLHELVDILRKLHSSRPQGISSEFIGFDAPVIIYDNESDSIKLFSWMEM
jgi:hypothetical protein